jgi:non-ribosomal peptide synthetase component F
MQQAVADVNKPLSQIDSLTPGKEPTCWKILIKPKGKTTIGGKKTLHRLFEDQVEKTPGEIALVCDSKTFTYKEFNEKANQQAREIRQKGAGPEKIIALLMESSLEMAVAVMAVLKAGAAYLPIDREIPKERKKYIMADSRVTLVICDHHADPDLESPATPGEIETINTSDEQIHAREDDGTNPEPLSQPGNLAYIIYTSGSTGNPKGVMVEHRQVVNTLVYRKQEYRMTAEHCALNLFSYAFDGFITSFFTPIISGARVVLLSKQTIEDMGKIIATIGTNRVTHLISVPVLYHVLVTNMTAEQAATLQVVTLAGDKLPANLLEATAAKNKNIEIVNEYGITEAAVMSTIYRHQEKTPKSKSVTPSGTTPYI